MHTIYSKPHAIITYLGRQPHDLAKPVGYNFITRLVLEQLKIGLELCYTGTSL